MGLFDKKATLGAAMLALVGVETVSAEMATAANTELEGLGITGAALVTPDAYQALEAKAGLVEAAQAAQATAEGRLTALTEAVTAAGASDVAALAAQRDEWKTKAEAFGSQAGAMGTTAAKEGNDISEGTPATAAQKAIDELPHNQALDNNPLFAGR